MIEDLNNLFLKEETMKSRAMLNLVFMVTLISIMILSFKYESFGQSDFPNKPIEVIVPYTPGGGVDLGVRFFSDKWAEFLGQPVVIINKPGAGGYIGGKFVALAKPDGYTLLGSSESNLMLTPLLRKEPDYTIDSLRILFFFSKTYLYFNVRADSRWKTLHQFLAEAKNNPGKLKFSTYGVGSSPHCATEMLSKVAGVNLTLIPFKSSPESMTALIGGNVDMCVVFGVPGVTGTGLVRQLAVGDYERTPDFPNVPTLKELGYDLGYNTSIYLGLSAPVKTPEKIVSKLIEVHDKVRQKYAKEISDKLPKLDQHPTHIDGITGMKIHKEKEKIFKELIPQIGIKIE
jgi:tripartite-type tricarboxylate transporter receptor subunit TctC